MDIHILKRELVLPGRRRGTCSWSKFRGSASVPYQVKVQVFKKKLIFYVFIYLKMIQTGCIWSQRMLRILQFSMTSSPNPKLTQPFASCVSWTQNINKLNVNFQLESIQRAVVLLRIHECSKWWRSKLH